MPLPADVRLMNMATALLLTVFVLLALGGGAWWLIRHPMFDLQAISVQGEVHRNNVVTMRAHVMPQLEGNFFTLDLEKAREAFESVPWVRVAVVHRDFPNRLRSVLQEHQPLAVWGDEGASTMLNQQGQVFEANLDDVDAERLVRLKGPDAESWAVAQMFHALSPRFEAMELDIEMLELTPRGSWRVQTQSGARMELGRGTPEELAQKLDIFRDTLTQVTARYDRTITALVGADLRHKEGYALRLHGVTTVESNSKKP